MLLAIATTAFAAPEIKPHDGKPADMAKPVQVFILLGQSNMVGLGKVGGPDGSLEFAVKEKKKYPYLVDDAGAWVERKDVRYARVMSGRGGGMQRLNNEWMTVKTCNTIGPEFGIAPLVGDAIAARYEQNLVHFIKSGRKEFNAPAAKFVLATMGESAKGGGGNGHYGGKAEVYMDSGEAMGRAMVELLKAK